MDVFASIEKSFFWSVGQFRANSASFEISLLFVATKRPLACTLTRRLEPIWLL